MISEWWAMWVSTACLVMCSAVLCAVAAYGTLWDDPSDRIGFGMLGVGVMLLAVALGVLVLGPHEL